MSGRGLRIRPLPGEPGRIAAAIETPDGETRVLTLVERTDLLPGSDLAPQIDGDYGSNGSDLTWAAVGVLPLAMNLGVDLIVEGSVQEGLSSRLAEYSEIWHDWRPDLFVDRVGIQAEDEVTLGEDRRGSLVAFSGGLDSLHTLRQVRREDPEGPVAAVMLWGFDHSKEDPTFADYARKAALTLADEGIQFHLVETNWKEVGSVYVPMDYATGLASALHGFGHEFRRGFCGADYHRDFADRFIPCGHNPVTDSLLSSGQFQVETIGYDHTRLEKCEDVSSDPVALELLRVCGTYNCGVCEKCQRTRWGLYAVGCDHPPTFGRRLPLPRPWITVSNQWSLEVLEGMWTPSLERAESSGRSGLGLRMLRIQHAMVKWQAERRGPWRFGEVRLAFEKITNFEMRVRGKIEKLRRGSRGRRWKRTRS